MIDRDETIDELLQVQYLLSDTCKKYERALEEIKTIVSGNYEILDPLAKQQIQKIVSEALEEE